MFICVLRLTTQALCFIKETELLFLRTELVIKIMSLNLCLFSSIKSLVCSWKLPWTSCSTGVSGHIYCRATECQHLTSVIWYHGSFGQQSTNNCRWWRAGVSFEKTSPEAVWAKNSEACVSVISSRDFSLVSWFTQAGNRLAGVLAGLTGDVYWNCPEMLKIIQVYFCIFSPPLWR